MKILRPSHLVDRARHLAAKAHSDQKYGDEFPYIIHPTLVDGVLLRFGDFDESRRAAAYTHDVLEDTETTYEELVTFLGKYVADIVAALTEPKGGNRKWRHEMTYPRIVANPDAVIVKLADRIANVESGGKKVGMYVKEHAEFKAALYHPKYNDFVVDMWAYLDNLIIEAQPTRKIVTI